MNDSTLLPLLEKYIEGTLNDAERAELEKLLVSSVAARHTFWEYLEQHAFIGELSGEAKGRALARLEKPPTRRSTPAPAPRRSRPNSGTLPLLIAAGVLIGFIVILLASMSGSDPDDARSMAAFRAKQAERRKAAEARLREIEQERQRLLARPVAPEGKPEPRKEEERKKALDELAERQRKVDEELRQVIDAKPPVIVEKKPEATPTPLLVPEKPTTVAAAPTIAKIGKVEGAVLVDQKPATAGQELAAGQSLETGAGSVEIVYLDATRVGFGPGSVARDFKVDGGKRFWLEVGSILAVVSKQPKGQPMVVESTMGEATVVGTTLRIRIDPDAAKGMRLEVEEGIVQLKNRLTGKTVPVDSGHYAVAAAGTEIKSLPLPIEEIVLLVKDGKRDGNDWRTAKDDKALSGTAWECPWLFNRNMPGATQVMAIEQIPSRVTFTFMADADKDYVVWVRGQCMAPDKGTYSDSVILQFPGGRVTKPANQGQMVVYTGQDRAAFNGWGNRAGYWWIAGNADFFNAAGEPLPTASPESVGQGDAVPVTVKFARGGPQTIRMYSMEAPLRVDAVWLSTSQKSRPEDGARGK